jgi:hypothetical protein
MGDRKLILDVLVSVSGCEHMGDVMRTVKKTLRALEIATPDEIWEDENWGGKLIDWLEEVHGATGL